MDFLSLSTIQNESQGSIKIELLIPWLRSALFKIRSLHGRNMTQKYLHPANILVSSSGAVEFQSNVDETASYSSPELLFALDQPHDGTIFTPENDMWAIGCILFETVLGYPPLAGQNPTEVLQSIFDRFGTPTRFQLASLNDRQFASFPFADTQIPVPSQAILHFSDESTLSSSALRILSVLPDYLIRPFCEAIRVLLKYNPFERATANDVLSLPLFNPEQWTELIPLAATNPVRNGRSAIPSPHSPTLRRTGSPQSAQGTTQSSRQMTPPERLNATQSDPSRTNPEQTYTRSPYRTPQTANRPQAFGGKYQHPAMEKSLRSTQNVGDTIPTHQQALGSTRNSLSQPSQYQPEDNQESDPIHNSTFPLPNPSPLIGNPAQDSYDQDQYPSQDIPETTMMRRQASPQGRQPHSIQSPGDTLTENRTAPYSTAPVVDALRTLAQNNSMDGVKGIYHRRHQRRTQSTPSQQDGVRSDDLDELRSVHTIVSEQIDIIRDGETIPYYSSKSQPKSAPVTFPPSFQTQSTPTPTRTQQRGQPSQDSPVIPPASRRSNAMSPLGSPERTPSYSRQPAQRTPQNTIQPSQTLNQTSGSRSGSNMLKPPLSPRLRSPHRSPPPPQANSSTMGTRGSRGPHTPKSASFHGQPSQSQYGSRGTNGSPARQYSQPRSEQPKTRSFSPHRYSKSATPFTASLPASHNSLSPSNPRSDHLASTVPTQRIPLNEREDNPSSNPKAWLLNPESPENTDRRSREDDEEGDTEWSDSEVIEGDGWRESVHRKKRVGRKNGKRKEEIIEERIVETDSSAGLNARNSFQDEKSRSISSNKNRTRTVQFPSSSSDQIPLSDSRIRESEAKQFDYTPHRVGDVGRELGGVEASDYQLHSNPSQIPQAPSRATPMTPKQRQNL
ncbi:hypothetical protein BLNAU_11426 [Blattamonas nauphoetae]|uniref:Protein kinase domain-containing protein n=1 Tax=Blattamonas nauphoetae TaxID=2049346 RepID=A0ABQ9XRW7_9EUKA|nr:hypothetical protein BLNAU_11426 [Blattamonas nauphoetae]